MKPLTNTKGLLKRFNNFKDGEIRSIEVLSPTTMKIILAGQDESRAFDWITIHLEFHNVSDAKLLENSKLSFVDMSDGVSVIKSDTLLAFGIGECYNSSSLKNSSCFIECQNIKYEEGFF